MEREPIKLTRESKIYLLKALESGYIDMYELAEMLGIALTIQIKVVESGVPLASREEDIVP